MAAFFSSLNTNPGKIFSLPLLILPLLLALSGCMPTAFSPETAALQSVVEVKFPDFTLDRNTVQIVQRAPLGDRFVYLITYQGNRVNTGRESCLFVYEVHKAPFGGWTSGSGGGGCSNAQPQDQQPISLGSNTSGSSGNNDPGFSAVNGEVFDEKIVQVQVTWNDGQVQQVDVVKNTFLAVRAGQFGYQKAEALDKDQNVIFQNEIPAIAPGKQ